MTKATELLKFAIEKFIPAEFTKDEIMNSCNSFAEHVRNNCMYDSLIHAFDGINSRPYNPRVPKDDKEAIEHFAIMQVMLDLIEDDPALFRLMHIVFWAEIIVTNIKEMESFDLDPKADEYSRNLKGVWEDAKVRVIPKISELRKLEEIGRIKAEKAQLEARLAKLESTI